MNDPKQLEAAAKALRKAAMNEEAKDYVLSHPELYALLRKAADRYIGGENLGQTLKKASAANAAGHKCSIEFMGENTKSVEEAEAATGEFLEIVRAIDEQGLDSTVSFDLSHLGLVLSPELAAENLGKICAAAGPDREVTISAEDWTKTDQVLDTYRRLSPELPNLSITVQAYLHRSRADLESLVGLPGRIRLVKGAFETPPDLALSRGSELNRRYLELLDFLLAEKSRVSVATHDPAIQQAAVKILNERGTPRSDYEFESLFGIQTAQLDDLRDLGHPTKLYFVYGREWYLYLLNRIAENPVRIFQALADVAG